MTTTTMRTIRRAEGTDEIWTAAATLFSEHYGVWGSDSERQGERIKLGKKRLLAQYLPDERSIYATVTVNGTLAGQAFASRWEHDGRTVCWITQLVVQRDYRRRDLARELLRQLREDGDEVFGIMSSNPAACLAAAGAFAESIEETDLDFIKSHARQVLAASPVPYV